MSVEIGPEQPQETDAIGRLTTAAFATAPHSSGTEAAIVDALRRAGALTLSLVARQDGAVVGHVAFSPVTIDGEAGGWFGLGPVSVRPDRQRRGIGAALIRDGLDRLRRAGAEGCVLLGDPGYYERFGFRSVSGLRLADVPAEYVLALPFGDRRASGLIVFHEAFSAS